MGAAASGSHEVARLAQTPRPAPIPPLRSYGAANSVTFVRGMFVGFATTSLGPRSAHQAHREWPAGGAATMSQDLHSHMALLGVKLDSRNLLNSDGLQVQLMQILQVLAEYGVQFKEHDKRIDQNLTQIRELKCVPAAGRPASRPTHSKRLRPPCAHRGGEPGPPARALLAGPC